MAKRFQFRLEVVRKLRERAHDEQRRVVAGAIGAVAGAERRIERLSDQLRETVEVTRGERLTERLDVAALRGQQFYRSWLHGRLLDSDAALAKKKVELDLERAKLGEASAQLKAIEKLRERRWKRYLVQVRREEQAVNDEVASRMAAHPTAQGRIGGGT
ncbi:MAG: flagellar FliJ family protein [Planctomycetota bacterium]